MTAARYRKKPVEIEAVQMVRGNTLEVVDFIRDGGGTYRTVTHPRDSRQDEIFVITLEGEMRAVDGDWIIKGVAGEFYPCRDDIFRATYETVAPGPAATEATEAATSALREQIAEALADATGGRWPAQAFLTEADAVLAVIRPGTRITATLARMADADVQRVITLYERWVAAGPPPLGTSMSRWWDARLAELHNAILPPTDQPKG